MVTFYFVIHERQRGSICNDPGIVGNKQECLLLRGRQRGEGLSRDEVTWEKTGS